MAVRIQFFTITGGDFEVVPIAALDAAVAAFDAADPPVPPADAAALRCVGWLSASDDDEERFSDWCDEVDDDLGIGLLQHGRGEAVGLTPPALTADSAGADGGWATRWSEVLRGALQAAGGGRIGWRTEFDESGTTGTTDDYSTEGHAEPSPRP